MLDLALETGPFLHLHHLFPLGGHVVRSEIVYAAARDRRLRSRDERLDHVIGMDELVARITLARYIEAIESSMPSAI